MDEVDPIALKAWLKEENLWRSFCRSEKGLYVRAMRGLSQQEKIDLSWRREALYALCWSIGLVTRLGPVTSVSMSNIEALLKRIPPEISVSDFLKTVKCRADDELLYGLDLHYCLHSAFRNGDAPNLDISVLRERRTALEWLGAAQK